MLVLRVVQAVQALRAISVLCVCIGPEEEEAFRTVRRPLRVLITRSRHPEVRVAAVHTLALACFICSTDEDDTSDTLDLLARVFSRTVDGEYYRGISITKSETFYPER